MRYAGRLQRGEVVVVFEGKYRESTRYRVLFDGGGCCESANPFELEAETPLEMLARAGKET